MIRISGLKIQDVANKINGLVIEDVTYTFTGKVQGIQAYISTDSDDEEKAKDNLKKYLKQNMGYLKLYYEIV